MPTRGCVEASPGRTRKGSLRRCCCRGHVSPAIGVSHGLSRSVTLEGARVRLLAWGRGVDVLDPSALRRSVLDTAEQIVALYSR